jgi:hypothetical protein
MLTVRDNMAPGASPSAIVPKTFAEAQAFASALSHSALVPDKLREKAADVLMIILAGAELEIPPVRSLSLFHVIEGVPKLSADGVAARAMASGRLEYLEPREQSDTRVTWAAKRYNRPEVVLTWTLEDAKRANLIRTNRDGSPGNWMKYPRQMLNARCKADLSRMIAPEVVAGLVSAEETYDGVIEAQYHDITPQAFVAPPPPPPAPAPTPTPAAPPPKAQSGKRTKPSDTVIDAKSTEVTPTPDPTPAPTPPADVASTEPLPADLPASDEGAPPADESGFGGEDPVDSERPKTMEDFKIALAGIRPGVGAKGELDAVKAEWVPWSVVPGSNPPKPQPWAREMRELFAKRKAELGV